MSAPKVNVLAVLDEWITKAATPANGVRMNVELRETRAAVAELIEAVEAIRATRGGTMALGAQDARTVRLWAALARVGGVP